jgi:hypothetical protein
MTSPRNDALINNLSGDFQKRYEPNFAFCNAVSMYQLLPSLRGFWPVSSVNESGSVFDISGQGRTLTNSSVTFAYGALAPYAAFNGAAYLCRADEAGTSITGGLTLGCWVYFTNAASAAEDCITKSNPTGNQLSYVLRRNATGNAEFYVSGDGAAQIFIDSAVTMAAATWYFIAATYIPSTVISVWINDSQAANAVSVPAAIYNSTAQFLIGARDGPANYVTGRIALPFLCATYFSSTIVNTIFEQTRALFGV